LEKFNVWERELNRSKTPAQTFEEFCHLYALIFELEPEQRERGHREHLAHLVEMQKRLKIKASAEQSRSDERLKEKGKR